MLPHYMVYVSDPTPGGGGATVPANVNQIAALVLAGYAVQLERDDNDREFEGTVTEILEANKET